MHVHNKKGSMRWPALGLMGMFVKLQTEMVESLIPVGFRGFGDKSIYSAAMRWCSSINLWFSSSSFLLWRSKALPLWRLWTSNSVTASVGSGTAFSSTEPILNLKQGHNKSGSDLLITLKPCRGTHTLKKEGIHITIDGSYFFKKTMYWWKCSYCWYRHHLEIKESAGHLIKTIEHFLFKKREVQFQLLKAVCDIGIMNNEWECPF